MKKLEEQEYAPINMNNGMITQLRWKGMKPSGGLIRMEILSGHTNAACAKSNVHASCMAHSGNLIS